MLSLVLTDFQFLLEQRFKVRYWRLIGHFLAWVERVLLLELQEDPLVVVEEDFTHDIIAFDHANQTDDIKISG